ncbi:MAG: ATP phosphoribosyltransferase regulatory subunit [Bacillota bacterium]|nr:ATP phosphoribosyltransferase regulatory subunit [Bacillota bacterium]
MNNLKRYIPDGTQDMLFDECRNKVNIEKIFRDTFTKVGYEEVVTPTLEFYDVFNAGNQPIEQEKMYKLFDNHGRIMVLRPDVTIPIARVAATKLKDSIYPLKLFYSCNVFKVNENLNAKMSEITQAGIEIIGIDNFRADAESILMAIKALLNIGLKDFKIELGQADFFKGLIEDIKLESEELERLRKLVESKNYVALREFIDLNSSNIEEDTKEVLKKLPELFGTIEVINEASKITKNAKALMALQNIREIYKIINETGYGSYIAIDLGMVQHINYYTGIIFRGYVDEIGKDILSGGRYDNLIEQFGKKLSATGFAVDVDSVLSALYKQGNTINNDTIDYMVFFEAPLFNEAYKLVNNMQDKGINAELSLLDNEEETFKYASLKGIKKVVSFKEKDFVELHDVSENKTAKYSVDKFIY